MKSLKSFVLLFEFLCTCCLITDGGRNSEYYDYVIVGGGPSGLSQLAFLNQVLKNQSFLLIERKPRLGGRIFTSYLEYENKSIHFENNAMRFRYNNYLSKIFTWLNLCDDDEIVPVKSTPQESKRSYYYRNQSNGGYRATALDEQNIYNFDQFDDALLFYDGLNNSLTQLIIDHLVEYNNGSSIENIDKYYQCIYNWTISNTDIVPNEANGYFLVLDLLNVSTEYMSYDIFGPETDYGESNAFPTWFTFCQFDMPNALDTFADEFANENGSSLSSSSSGLFTFKSGYKQLPMGLYEKIIATKDENNNNVKIMFNSEVTGVSGLKSQTSKSTRQKSQFPYFVRVRDTCDWLTNNYDRQRFQSTVAIPNIYANNVILTVPPRDLKTLFPSIEAIRSYQNISDALFNSLVQVIPSFRINMVFDDLDFKYYLNNNSLHRAQTDLGISTIYIEDWWQDESLFALQFYVYNPQAHWLNGLQAVDAKLYQSGESFELDNDSKQDLLFASQSLVNQITKELSVLTEYNDIPKPIAVFTQSLGFNDSNLDGLYYTKAGYDEWELSQIIRHPLKDENIFVISSEYSLWPGWSYGAIQAAYDFTVTDLGLNDPLQNVSFCYY